APAELPQAVPAPAAARASRARLRPARAPAGPRLRPQRSRAALPRAAIAGEGGPRPLGLGALRGGPGPAHVRAHPPRHGAPPRGGGVPRGHARAAGRLPQPVRGVRGAAARARLGPPGRL
ncbi:MAG: hypothetical protein AVDCRST_MAG13-3196, partial [uncultured Solirubrobacteraceae bacterium]